MTYKIQCKFQEFRTASVNNVVNAGRKDEQEMDLSDVDDGEVDDESAQKSLQESKKRKLDSPATQVSLKLKLNMIDFVKTT